MVRSHHEDEDPLATELPRRRHTILRPPISNDEEGTALWELDTLEDMSNWSKKEQEAALSYLKSVIKDYISMADERNKLYRIKDRALQLQGEVKNLTEENNGIKARMAEYETRIREQDVIVTYLQGQLGRSSASPDQNTGYRKTSILLPNPQQFTGSPKDNLEDWLAKMRVKLNIDKDMYDTEELRMALVQSLVGGDASKQLTARLQPNHPKQFTTAEEMFDALDKTFGEAALISSLREIFG